MSSIFLLGAPCSGKGTQCRILDYSSKSAGEILRQSYPIGTEERRKLDNGELVSIDIINGLMGKVIEQHNFNIIIDGYPRTLEQARFIANFLKNREMKIILLDVKDKDVLINRMYKRKYCTLCERTFDRQSICCGIETITRLDDNLNTFEKRLKIYQDNIEIILQEMNCSPIIIDASSSIENVNRKIKEAI